MDILKRKGVDWKERRLIQNLYVQQKVRIRIGNVMSEGSSIGRGVRQGCCLSPLLFNVYLEEIIAKGLDGKRGICIGGKRIECIRFADDMVLLAESERTANNMLKDLNEACVEYGMQINTAKTKSMVISTRCKQANIKIGQATISQVSAFKYLGSTITEDLRCHQEVKTRIAIAKEAFNRKRRLLCGKLDKDLRKRLGKCFVWSVALYGAETWTLRREDEKRLEAFEMWMWRRMERISWMERVSNERVLERIGERRCLLKVIRERKKNWLGHSLRRECLLKDALEGLVCGRRLRGRRRYKMIDDIKGSGNYVDLKRKAEDRTAWRTTT